jgi:hypothetical protein
MSIGKLFEGFSKTEKLALSASSMAVLICLLFLFFFDFSGQETTHSSNQLGQISELSNDIRHKTDGKVFWSEAKKNQNIKTGDKIFTGKQSNAQVTLKNNSLFNIGENSLVEFKDHNNQKLPDFALGTFNISVKGKVKILIAGKVAEITGNGTEVQVMVDKNKNIKLKSSKGTPKITYEKKEYSLNEADGLTEIASAETSQKATLPLDLPVENNYNHILTFYDVYKKVSGRILYRDSSDRLISKKIILEIPDKHKDETLDIEHSDNPLFSQANSFRLKTADAYLAGVYTGKNFWRHRSKNSNWSEARTFDIAAALLPIKTTASSSETRIPLLTDGLAKVKFNILAPKEASAFVVEYSQESHFPTDKIKIFWSYQNFITLQFDKAGFYFCRFRSVNKDLQLGEWSETYTTEVFAPPALAAPTWDKESFQTLVDEPVDLTWTSSKKLKKFTLNIFDVEDKLLLSKELTQRQFSWNPKRPGIYKVQLIGKDKYGRASPPSQFAEVKVEAPVFRLSRKEKKQKRLLSSTELTTQVQTPKYTNDIYIEANMSLGVAYFLFHSAAQTSAVADPTSPGISASGLVWLNNHGVEGIIQKNISGSADATTATTDFVSAEIRYRYRFTPRGSGVWNAFQSSAFAGYELYRNSDDTYFIDKYDLFKAGIAIDIPIMDSWLMAGQIAYGWATAAAKYEAGFNVDYFFSDQWSMGAGYKLHLLEFEQSEKFPTFSVFREGYTNSTFNLRYFF